MGEGAGALDGQVAVVTGSSRGIGRAVAERLAAEGAAVVVNGREPGPVAEVVAGLTAAGRRSIGVSGSAADPAVADALVGRAVEDLGGLDVLVTCAGTAEPPGSSILAVTSAQWHALLDAHLTATFEACRAAAPHLVAQGRGAIVTTSSHAWTGAYGGTGYPAGKGGVNSLTFALAAELREHGVRVNAVCPGARTRLSTGADYEAHIERLHERGLLDDVMYAGSRDPGPPEHAAALYAFLASDAAAGISGELFAAAGGYVGRFIRAEELLAWRDHAGNPPWSVAELAAVVGASAVEE